MAGPQRRPALDPGFHPLSLTLGVPTQVDGSGGVIVGSNPSAGVLRGTTDGTAAKTLTNNTATALAYIWANSPITAAGAAFHGFEDDLMIEVSRQAATANGVGMVIGFTSSPTGFAGKWFGLALVRDGSGTVTVESRSSDLAPQSIGTGQAFRGGGGVRFGNRRSTAWSNVCYYQYDSAAPTSRYNTTARTVGASQHADLAGITTLYPFVAFVGSTTTGYVQATLAVYRYARTTHISPV